LKGIDESLPNQHKTGGQSAPRFGRIREEKIGWYVKKIAEMMVQFYIKDNIFQCKGLIIAGPAQMKDLIQTQDLFLQHFYRHLLQSITIAEITEQSIRQVIAMTANIFTTDSQEIATIRQFDEKLADANQIDLLIFGTDEVLIAFNNGDLREIYVGDKSNYLDFIMKSSTKTMIKIIRSTEFTSKYGDLVGIKYY